MKVLLGKKKKLLHFKKVTKNTIKIYTLCTK